MKINILCLMFLVTSAFVKGQPLLFSGILKTNCGTWQDKITYSEWQGVDTLGIKQIKDTLRKWVYNETDEPLESSNETYAVFCPCGCMWDSHWWQYRICSITGIRQKRLKTQSWTMTPAPEKPKTEYEQVIESFK